MKTLKIISTAALIALMFVTTQSLAQRGNRANRTPGLYNCYQNIPNLTEQQQQQIQELRTAHLNKMQELRQERRTTANWDEKGDIRGQMLERQKAHRDTLRSLLNEEQKAWFDENDQNYRMNTTGRGGRTQGRGRGNGYHGGRGGGNNRTW